MTTALNMFVCFLATRGASAESCGPWRVRKVSDGVQGVEISLIRGDGLSGEGLGAVRANGRECVRRRVAETRRRASRSRPKQTSSREDWNS